MCPWLCFTIPYTVERPSPVPFPGGLVVKNGSKTRDRIFTSIPHPVSLTRNVTYFPGLPTGCKDTDLSSMSRFAVSIVSFPPPGIASRALTARLTTTCSICPGSAFTLPNDSAENVVSSMSSPISRRSIISMPKRTRLRLITFGSRTRLRQEDAAVPVDGRQEIVEVMGDPPGEPPDRFHLLRLAELLLRLLPLGDLQFQRDVRFPQGAELVSHV